MTGNRLTINDLRRASLCVSGLRNWCAERDIDFRDFVKNGILVEDARKLGEDAIIDRVLEIKEQQNG